MARGSSGGAGVGGGLDNEAAQFVGDLIDEVNPGALPEQRATIFEEVARAGSELGAGSLTTRNIRRIINNNV